MPIVSLLKADAAVREKPREADKLLRRLLLPFEGGETYFSSAEPPLFLLDLSLPAENVVGVNFDLRLAYAVIALAKSCGCKRIRLGVKVEAGFSFVDVLEKSGYARLRELPEVEFIDLRATSIVHWPTDVALILDEAALYQPVVAAEVIISLAKYRAGEGLLFGGALQNVACVAAIPSEFSFAEQQRAVVDLYSLITPDLTIVDGLRGEGNFQPQKQDFILAASDAVAADAVLSAIGGLDLAEIEYLQLAAQYGLGVGEPAEIALFGDEMTEIMA